MKKYLNFLLCAITIALFSCSKEDNSVKEREVYLWGYTLSLPPDGKREPAFSTFLFFDGKYADKFTPKTYYATENKHLADYLHNMPLDTVYKTLLKDEMLLLDDGTLVSPEYSFVDSHPVISGKPSTPKYLPPGDYFIVAFYGGGGWTQSDYKNKYACKRITITENEYVFLPITVVIPREYTVYGNITWINLADKYPESL